MHPSQGAAPAYLCYFAWKSPALSGRLRAPHTIDIPFVFDNTEVPNVRSPVIPPARNERHGIRLESCERAFAAPGRGAGGASLEEIAREETRKRRANHRSEHRNESVIPPGVHSATDRQESVHDAGPEIARRVDGIAGRTAE